MAAMPDTPEAIVLRCQCGLPWAEVRDGYLWVQSRHRGKHHMNGMPLALLARMAAGETVTAEQLRPVSVEPDGVAGLRLGAREKELECETKP